MKSFHVACAAIGTTVATLGAVAVQSGAIDRLLGQSYDRAIASTTSDRAFGPAAAAHGNGSEHFWLTQQRALAALAPTRAVVVGTAPASLADIKRAVAATGTFDAGALEVLSIQEIARVSVATNAAGRALLVTARIAATADQPARIIRVVLDAGVGAGDMAGRAL
jgi:hypothetical protein